MTEVVAAYIRKKERFLVCQRPGDKACPLMWEFVGGKVEAGETKEEALVRECKEELGIKVSVGEIFTEVEHDYPNMKVHLTLYHCKIVEGTPQKLEHPDIRWITPDEIPDYDFCPADEGILQLIQENHRIEKELRHAEKEMLDRAILLAVAAHKGQEDKGGEPYIIHPLRVMTRCETNVERICAVLHDVVEDSSISLEDLKSEGFTDEIIETVDCLTRRRGEGYFEFIDRLLKNKTACKVKLADLADNMNPHRIKELSQLDVERMEKYEKAKARIESIGME